MQWALLVMVIMFLIVAYVVMQGTRVAMAWRKAAEDGDVKIIGEIVEGSLTEWRSKKKPKEIAVDVWRGMQSTQLVEVAADFVRVSCQAESEYRREGKSWVESANPIQTGMAITARVAEIVFYDLPHFRPARIQIDVYTTFRDGDGGSSRACIMSTEADRSEALAVDWDEWTGEEVADSLGARYRMGERGQPLPIEVADPVVEDETEETPMVNS
jgi:hypothetical protein